MDDFIELVASDSQARCLCGHRISVHDFEGEEHACQYDGCRCPTYFPAHVEGSLAPATARQTDN